MVYHYRRRKNEKDENTRQELDHAMLESSCGWKSYINMFDEIALKHIKKVETSRQSRQNRVQVNDCQCIEHEKKRVAVWK